MVRWNDISKWLRCILSSANLLRGLQIITIMKGAKEID